MTQNYDDLAEQLEQEAYRLRDPQTQSQLQFHSGRYQGAKDTVYEMAMARFGDPEQAVEFTKAYAARIDTLAAGGQDPDLFPEIIANLGGAAPSAPRSAPTGGPDLVRKQSYGGALTPERYRNMSSDERAALSPEQVDAMTARLAAERGGFGKTR
jgi:hypothetical protein